MQVNRVNSKGKFETVYSLDIKSKDAQKVLSKMTTPATEVLCYLHMTGIIDLNDVLNRLVPFMLIPEEMENDEKQ